MDWQPRLKRLLCDLKESLCYLNPHVRGRWPPTRHYQRLRRTLLPVEELNLQGLMRTVILFVI